ncbi:MAG: hypothetical protein FWE78_04460, partial [Methanimicrococcus sp.]|nr:hypothetical protein [Methanimicrococcus sp.]
MMNFKKIIAICIVLMILTPSFSFAFEAEPSGSSYGRSSTSDSSQPDSNQNVKTDMVTENFDNYDFSDSEEINSDVLLKEENLEEFDSLDDEPLRSGITTEDPSLSFSALTSVQFDDFSFSNDAYLTSLFSGAAAYTYPIVVPKGIAGFQPRIDLAYNSQNTGGTYGWLGDGWSLNEYYILRDVNYTPNDISDDRFKLMFGGQAHDLIYSETDGFYHTKIETYTKIQKVAGGSNQKEEYWTVTTKDGTEYRFGYTSDSELLNSVPDRDYVTKWKLDQIKDVNGNLIVYNYVKNPVSGEIGTSYLKNISYNDGFNVIEFDRTDKPVIFNEYRDGNRISEKCLLSSISIKADDQLVYQYQIAYQYQLPYTSDHVFLKSISLVGTNSESLPATTFNYGYINGQYDFEYVQSLTLPVSVINNSGQDQGVRFVDLNGDGLPDIVRSFGSTRSVWINTGNSFVSTSSWSIPVAIINNNQKQGVQFIDINGDGLPDIVQSMGTTRNVWTNTGSAFVPNSSWSIPAAFIDNSGKDQGVRFVDLNGDGLPDIVQSFGSTKNVWINTGS